MTAEVKVKTFINFPTPFRMGDVVREVAPGDFGSSSEKGYKARRRKEWEQRDKGTEHIIHAASFGGSGIHYSTNHGAWYDHKQFELIRGADTQSLTELYRRNCDEDDENFE